jgi:hypothetical protein
MRQATYEIHLRGTLPSDLVSDLDGATCREVGGETTLLTLDVDQEALHELVARLRDLGIELLELRRVSGPGPVGAREGQ